MICVLCLIFCGHFNYEKWVGRTSSVR